MFQQLRLVQSVLDKQGDPTHKGAEHLARAMQFKSDENAIIDQIIDLITPKQSIHDLEQLIEKTMRDRIAQHLYHMIKSGQPSHRPVYLTRTLFTIFIKQAAQIALRQPRQPIHIRKYTDIIKAKIEDQETNIMEEAQALRERYPFSKHIFLYQAQQQLQTDIKELIRIVDEATYIAITVEATQQRQQAGSTLFLLRLHEEAHKRFGPPIIDATIDSNPDLKKKKARLLKEQDEISQIIRNIQNRLAEPVDTETLRQELKSKVWGRVIALRTHFHALRSAAVFRTQQKTQVATMETLEREAFEFIQWHIDHDQASLAPPAIAELEKLAAMTPKQSEPQPQLPREPSRRVALDKILHFANGSRKHYQVLTQIINSSSLEVAKETVSTTFHIFVTNHCAIQLGGLTSMAAYPTAKIATAKHKIEIALQQASNQRGVQLAVDTTLDALGIPRALVRGQILLYPAIPLVAATPAIAATKSPPPPQPKKKKKRKKKRNKAKKNVLQLIAEQVSAYLGETVTSTYDADTRSLVITQADMCLAQISWNNKDYSVAIEERTLSLRHSDQISNISFAQLVLHRIQLARTIPTVACFIEALKTDLQQDEEIVRMDEKATDDHLLCHLEFLTADKRRFECKIIQEEVAIRLEIRVTERKKAPYELHLSCNPPEAEGDTLFMNSRIILSLLTSPLLCLTSQLSSQLFMRGYGYQPYFFDGQTDFNHQINLAIVTPTGDRQSISLVEETGNTYLYFNPHPEDRANPHLPRFQLDPSGVQSLDHQALNAIENHASKIAEIDFLQRQILAATFWREARASVDLQTLIQQHLQARRHIEHYTKVFGACKSLEPTKKTWASEQVCLLNELFLIELHQFLQQELQQLPADAENYLSELIALTSFVARETHRQGHIFAALQSEIGKHLRGLHKLQKDTLPQLFPLHLLKKELLTTEDIALINQSITQASSLIKVASKGLKDDFNTLSKRFELKATETERLLQQPFCKLQQQRMSLTEKKHLTVESLSYIKNASESTLKTLHQLMAISIEMEATMHLSGTAALHLAGLIPPPYEMNSDLDIWILAPAHNLKAMRARVQAICPDAMPEYIPCGTQQFNSRLAGEAAFEVITGSGAIEEAFTRGSHTSHKAFAQIGIEDGDLCLESILYYAAAQPTQFCHVDAETFKPTQWNLQKRLRLFLFCCKIICKYGADRLSQALLINLSQALVRQPANPRDDQFMKKHFARCHPYVQTFLCTHHPELARRAELKIPSQVALAEVAVFSTTQRAPNHPKIMQLPAK